MDVVDQHQAKSKLVNIRALLINAEVGRLAATQRKPVY